MGNYNRLLSDNIALQDVPSRVFIGFDNRGNEVFGTEEERQTYLAYCETEVGDCVDYEGSVDLSHLVRKGE